MKSSRLVRTYQWARREFISVIPAIIYFFIVFNLIYYTVGLSIDPGERRRFTPLMVNICALLMGKVILIVNMLPFINLFPKKPLAYNITWKLFIYILFTFFLWVIDTLRLMHSHGHTLNESFQLIGQRMMAPLFWSTLIWLATVFFIFIVFSELIALAGKDKVKQVFFGSRA